ncbi:MAG: nitrous oxide reductase family maturation protein NosD [Sneathiella sp.]
MQRQRTYLWKLKVAATTLVAATLTLTCAQAREIYVETDLTRAITDARDGDTLFISGGIFYGPLTLSKSLSLIGVNNPTIMGNQTGSVITVTAPNTEIRGLTVTGSGLSLETQDSAIFLEKTATGAVVDDNNISNNLIGIYVSGAKNSLIRDNRITGRQDLRVNERGNGIQIWNAPGTIVEKNSIQFGRDGIFVTTSKRNIFRDNRMQDLRFAIHYMYTNKSEVTGNYSSRNTVGYALMSSTDLLVEGNISDGDRDRGLLFNYTNKIVARRNIVKGGPEKCVFIYNSNKNLFTENLFSDCAIGVHFTAGSERNIMTGNAFINNQAQVKYVGTRWLEWSDGGIGNYWSDHAAFDLDRNGLADSIYRPNDLTDRIIWQFPSAKLLINSPAVQLLKYAQAAFPALHPGGVIDSNPLMQIPSELAREVRK